MCTAVKRKDTIVKSGETLTRCFLPHVEDYTLTLTKRLKTDLKVNKDYGVVPAGVIEHAQAYICERVSADIDGVMVVNADDRDTETKEVKKGTLDEAGQCQIKRLKNKHHAVDIFIVDPEEDLVYLFTFPDNDKPSITFTKSRVEGRGLFGYENTQALVAVFSPKELKWLQ